ncbi:MAG: NCS2 family permease, partial [Verrucomicrobia bacterium]|nr:NCS2 family permease [Cytophagales bacterium]
MKDFFDLKAHKTTISTEVFAGIATFLASMYIIVVNPSILSQTGMSFSGVLTATVLLSFFCSLMMGLYARNPIVVAPGMGLNAFFTFSVVKGMGISYPVALGAVFWAGIIFLLLSVFNIRTQIIKAIPKPLRYAVSAGIGLFITFIGFVNAKFIIPNPDTLVSIGKISAPETLTFLVGLFLMAILLIRKVKAAIILGIVCTTLLAIPLGRWYGTQTVVEWKGLFATPDFSLLFALDLAGSLKIALFPVIFAFAFTDL